MRGLLVGIAACLALLLTTLLGCSGEAGRPLPAPQGVTPEQTFPTSLHGTRRGKITWYGGPGGFQSILQKPIEELKCLKCHPGTYADGSAVDPITYHPDCKDCHVLGPDGKPDLTKRVTDDICLKCHRRQAREIAFGFSDVHRQAGFRCMGCHTTREMHGDGREYASWLEPGAMDITCEKCHPRIPDNASHRIHQNTVHCTACHAQSVISCQSCHFPTKTPNTVLKDFVLLLNRQSVNKVYAGTFMLLAHGGKAFLAVAPYRAHTIVSRGRQCNDCHNNAAVQEYTRDRRITISRWDGSKPVIHYPNGIIPVPPNWQQAFQLAFPQPTNPDGNTTGWELAKEGAPDQAQMLYAQPLTPAQIDKLSRSVLSGP